ncbi:MAG: hypothetical protein KDB03_04530 [Planctomycetales bacterium]|nr:hypothetical protein [Planctomycetales bacterium]
MARPQIKSFGPPSVRPGSRVILGINGRRFNDPPQNPNQDPPTIEVQVRRHIGSSGQLTDPGPATILVQEPGYIVVDFVVPTHFTDNGGLVGGDEVEITVTNLGEEGGEDTAAYP